MDEKQFSNLYRETMDMFIENAGTEDQQYWQGRKDAMRLVFAMFDDERKESMRQLLDTSPGYIPTDREMHESLLSDAVYNVAAALYELRQDKNLHSLTRMNLKNFIRDYENLARNGQLPIIDDHCLVPDN